MPNGINEDSDVPIVTTMFDLQAMQVVGPTAQGN